MRADRRAAEPLATALKESAPESRSSQHQGHWHLPGNESNQGCPRERNELTAEIPNSLYLQIQPNSKIK